MIEFEIIETTILKHSNKSESQNDDQEAMDIQKHPSWKDIYSKRVQRQYRFPEKTKASATGKEQNQQIPFGF